MFTFKMIVDNYAACVIKLFWAKMNVCLNQLIKKRMWTKVQGHYISPEFIACRQRLICPVVTIAVLKLNRLLSGKFSKCLKAYQSCERAPRWLICIFRIKLLNTRTATYYFFLTVGELVWANTSDCARVAWSWHNRSHPKSKLTRSEALVVKLLK